MENNSKLLNHASNANQTVSRTAVWWFRIALTFSFFWYLLLLVVGCLFIIGAPSHREMYPLYMQAIAGGNGLFAIYLTRRKETLGAFWAVVPLVFLGLGVAESGFSTRDGDSGMLVFTVAPTLLLLSQIPYLKKLRRIPGKGFRKANFANGAPFSDEELAGLYDAWSAYNRATAVFDAGMALAIFHGFFLSYGLGGFIGNVLMLTLFFGVLILAFIINRPLKKRYLACRDKLGLTAKDIRQALHHEKRERENSWMVSGAIVMLGLVCAGFIVYFVLP